MGDTPVVAALDTDASRTVSPATTATTPATGDSANRRQQVYILMAAGAGGMLVCVCLLLAMKQTLASARRDQGSSSSPSSSNGASPGSGSQQRPGLADNPIFNAALFLPSEPGSSMAISATAGENASLPVAEAPPSFFCPITQDLMRDPVLIGDGHTYERDAIKQWLAGHSTSPMTNAPLDEQQRNMVPNHTLRSMIVEHVEKFIAENHPEPAAATVAGTEVDGADDGFVNPLSDSAPPVDDDESAAVLPSEAAPVGATFDVENGSGAVGTGDGATFDVEEAGSRRRGRTGLFAAPRGRNAGSSTGTPPADSTAATEEPGPEPEPAPEPLPTPAPARLTGPYSIEEFDPDLYSRQEMETVQVLLSQLASSGGLTFRVLAQYNITCPRRMAEDRRRRAVFREQQMQAQQRAAAAADG